MNCLRRQFALSTPRTVFAVLWALAVLAFGSQASGSITVGGLSAEADALTLISGSLSAESLSATLDRLLAGDDAPAEENTAGAGQGVSPEPEPWAPRPLEDDEAIEFGQALPNSSGTTSAPSSASGPAGASGGSALLAAAPTGEPDSLLIQRYRTTTALHLPAPPDTKLLRPPRVKR